MDKKDDYFKLLGEIIDEASGIKKNSVPLDEPKNNKNVQTESDKESDADNKEQKKNYHVGHRARVRNSVDTDPDFATFSDHEILEYLLFTTVPRIDTNELAHKLIETFGSFAGVLNATVIELKKINNIGENTARMLTSIVPAARRSEISRLRQNMFLDSSVRAVNYLHPFFFGRDKEMLYLACIDNNDRVISVNLISEGDIAFNTFDIKKVVEAVCRHGAAKAIIAHNHPAGTLEPSLADKHATTKIGVALSAMGVVLVDHIIFTNTNFYSFFSNGNIETMYEECDKMLGTNLMRELRKRKLPHGSKSRYIMPNKRQLFEEDTEEEIITTSLEGKINNKN